MQRNDKPRTVGAAPSGLQPSVIAVWRRGSWSPHFAGRPAPAEIENSTQLWQGGLPAAYPHAEPDSVTTEEDAVTFTLQTRVGRYST